MSDIDTAGRGLADELRNVVTQAEELLHAIGDHSDDTLGALRQRVHESVDAARARLADMEEETARMTDRAATAAENYVQENPWAAVAIGAGIGLVAGALLMRRRRGGSSLQ